MFIEMCVSYGHSIEPVRVSGEGGAGGIYSQQSLIVILNKSPKKDSISCSSYFSEIESSCLDQSFIESFPEFDVGRHG
jgi:hypothetical protein